MNVQPRGTCGFKSKVYVWMLACADPDFSAGGVLTIKQGLRVRFFWQSSTLPYNLDVRGGLTLKRFQDGVQLFSRHD